MIIISLTAEEKIIELIKKNNIKDSRFLYTISKKVNDKNKLELIKMLDESCDNRYSVYLFHSINSFEVYKEAIIIMNKIINFKFNLYDKVFTFDEKQQLELIPYIEDEFIKERIVKNFNDDENKINAIKYLSEDNKKNVILTLKSDEKKMKQLDLLTEMYDEMYYNRRKVIESLESDDNKIASLSYLDEYSKVLVISKLKSEEKKLELLESINSDEYKIKIIESFKDDNNKLKVLENVTNFEQRFKIISLIKNEDIKIEQSKTLIDNDEIFSIAKSLSDEGKKKILDVIEDSKTQEKIILLFKDEETIIELSKKVKKNRGQVLNHLSNKLSDLGKLELIKLLVDKNDSYYKSGILEKITDLEIFKEGLKYCETLTYQSSNRIKELDENEIVKILPLLTDDFLILELVMSFNIDDNKVIGFSYLNDKYKKIKVLKTLSEDNLIKCCKEYIDSLISLGDVKDVAQQSGYPADMLNSMIELEKNTINSNSNIEFSKNYNRLTGYGSKYRALYKYRIKEENIEIIDNIINEFIKECIKINDRYTMISLLSDNALLEYKDELNNKFTEGKYSDLLYLDNNVIEKVFDSKRIKVIKEYKKLNGKTKAHFANYIHNNFDKITEEKIDEVISLIFEVETSNSEEISKQSDSFIENLLLSDNSLEKLKKIKNIFLRNNLPRFAKTYLTFLIVHPEFNSYVFKNTGGKGHNVSSVILNNISPIHRKALVLNDLLKCSLKSNSIDLMNYLNRLEKLNKVFIYYQNSEYELLNEDIKLLLIEYRDCINILYDNFLRHNNIEKTNNAINDLNNYQELLCKDNNITLSDSIVKAYFKYIGINTIKEAKDYVLNIVNSTNKKNKERYESNDFKIEKGDFIKSFNINYFFDMVNNGVVAKDYLGADMGTDQTALDTDLSRICDDISEMSLKDIIDYKDSDSGHFGQGYIVLKDNPEKINITSLSSNESYSRINSFEKNNIFEDKLEAFSNGRGFSISNPYGIRTGFSITDIDFIVFDEEGGQYRENIYKIILPLVMNGIYIPIISKQTEKVLFTYENFIELTNKMSGLKNYGINNYDVSNNIDNEQYRLIASKIDDSDKEINSIKLNIMNTFNEGLENNFNIVNNITGKLEKKEIQILDTGSTSRSTNIPYDGDFDFIVRIDRNIDIDSSLRKKFIEMLISKFDIVDKGRDINGDIKGMIIRINGTEYKLDLSFVRKTDKVSYSTEMCVSDRLSTIKELYPDKYKLVLANIIYAKKYLKKYECYSKGGYNQGGLGGIGVENWILQNGGSFYDAAINFISYAFIDNKQVPYEEFICNYFIWDFGENFYTDRENRRKNRTDNLHDNFISKNLTEEGYNKMCKCLKTFVEEYKLGNLENLDEQVNLKTK